MIENKRRFSPAAEKASSATEFWQRLERKYRIEINENKATVWQRRLLLHDSRVLTAKAILGTKAVELSFFHGSVSAPQLVFDVYTEQLLSEVNVASELRDICLFTVADWELALTTAASNQ